MADNVTTQAGLTSGVPAGTQIAADDIGGGVLVQRMKVGYGDDGAYQDASAAFPLPVTVANLIARLDTLITLLAAGLPSALTGGRLGTDTGSWLGSTAPTVGQKAMAASVPVVVASDQSGVPVGTVTPGAGASALGKAEDAVAGDGDIGVAILAVRRDAASSGVSANGDYANLSVDSSGALRTVGATAATEYTEDVPSVADPTGGILIARRRDTLTTSEVSTDLDNIALNATNKGQLHAYTEVGSVPAAARTTDSVSSALATDAIMSNLTALTPKFAKIVASASGATTIVSAVASKKLRVLRWDLVCNGAVNVKWQSATTPTDLTGLFYFAANGGKESSFCAVGHFETIAGEALNINLSGAVSVGGSLTYVEV